MKDNKIIYHDDKEIIEFPEIRTEKYNKDFYFGFYCTYFKERAERWRAKFYEGRVYGVMSYLCIITA